MLNTAITFEAYLEKANAAKTKDDLFKVYSQTVAQHGLDKVLLCLATDHRDIGESEALGFMYNYPADWMKYYFEKEFHKVDPVMIYSLSSAGSFTWDEIRKKMTLTKMQDNCLNLGQESGLHNGICTPLRGPNHAIAGLSLASSEKIDAFDGNVDMITAYSNHFYLAFRRLGEKKQGRKETVPNYALTAKERDVLTYLARGKTHCDVGFLLKMSSHTVDYHLRNIYKKLEVNDVTLAAVKALTYGLIHP